MSSLHLHRSLLAGLPILLLLSACSDDDYVGLYRTQPRAPSYTDEQVANLDFMGATLVDDGINFAAYAENATRIDLLLFDDPEATLPTRQFELSRFGDVWNLYVEGIGVGQYYGFIAWGPNWPHDADWYPGSTFGFRADVDADGNRYNPNKLLLDPYARAMHRDHDWPAGSLASGPSRAVSTFAAASKSVVVRSEHVWSDNETSWRSSRQDPAWVGHRWQDAIIYEVHPKGFTMGAVDPNVRHPGTYRGFGEMADYLQDLGVTAVELMPVQEKPLDGGYWGYQTIGFFMPELSYATTASQQQPGRVIDEFKWMVDELHQRGIEVILDVVYNHTGEGGLWREHIELDDISLDPFTASEISKFDPKEVAGLYAFRGFDNQAYYALSPDNQTYWNNTGVGNMTRCNHRPMQRLILDSLRYWVDEMHVDGFRFDLAPILGEEDERYLGQPGGSWSASSTVLQEIIDDPVLQSYNTRIIAEPWSIAGFFLGQFPAAQTRADVGWYEWNAHFRDWWRSFINEPFWTMSSAEGPIDGGGTLWGSQPHFGDDGRGPQHSVNFITVHDGFTLYDLVSYNEKSNLCGPLNPVCCDEPFSPFCDRDSGENHNRSRNWGDRACTSDQDCLADDVCLCKDRCGCDAGDAGAHVCVPTWNLPQPTCGSPGAWDGDANGAGHEPRKRQMMRNFFTATLIARGTPMLYAGDEWMRTQLGNNNAYSTRADNAFNWLDWGSWTASDARHRMHDFVRDVITFRKAHPAAFAADSYGAGATLDWVAPWDPTQPPDWNSRSLAMHYRGAAGEPAVYIGINMSRDWVDFQLPSGSWARVVDTQAYFDLPSTFDTTGAPTRESQNVSVQTPEPVSGTSYNSAPQSFVILEAQP